MNSGGNIMALIRPFLKGWPVIVLFFSCGLGLGMVNLYYAIPTYQTSATLMINDKESGASNFLKSFESFSVVGQLLTEVEVLRSKYLVNKSIDKLDVKIFYYNYRRSKKRNLYKKTPFRVQYTFRDSTFYNQHFQFFLKEDLSFDMMYIRGKKEEEVHLAGKVGSPVSTEAFDITVVPDSLYLMDYPDAFKPDHYGFTVFNKKNLISQFTSKDLVVSLPDENVAIVKLFFTHEVPQLAADFANTLAETYIEDFIDSKTGSASKALTFIDQQLDLVEEKLKEAEGELAKYKTKTKVVDLAMETDSKLKRLGELEIRKLNLELQQTALRDLLTYITVDSLNYKLNPNYESIQDAAFTDAVLKMNTLKTSRKELLQKYTESHPEVEKVEEDLGRTRAFLIQSVNNTLQTNGRKIQAMEQSISQTSRQFAKLPEVEKEIMLLKRQFMSQEQVYAFLLERRAEAAIGAASTISFHKILEPAQLPTVAISPQKGLILGLSAMIGIMLAFLTILMYHYFTSTVYYPTDLEVVLEIPMISQIKNVPEHVETVSQDFINLATNIHLACEARLITVTACASKEGKTKIAVNLAKALAGIGYKTLLIDADYYRPYVHQVFGLDNHKGLSQMVIEGEGPEACVRADILNNLDILPTGIQLTEIPTTVFLHPNLKKLLAEFENNYDRIIINAPFLNGVRDSIPLMQISQINLLVTRADKTRFKDIKEALVLLRRFQIPDVFGVLLQSFNHRKQVVYQMGSDPLPKMGGGARRALIKHLLKFLFFKKDASGNKYDFVPRMGQGVRRKAIWQTIKRLFNR